MYLTLLFALALAGGKAANVNRHLKLLEIDNHIQTDVIHSQVSKRFVSITKRPAAKSPHKPGTTLVLTCEANAAPAPSIRWFKNDAPVYEYNKEANEIVETNPTSFGRISSSLLISHTEQPAEYTCLVVAGLKTARASTIVYSTDGSSEITERSKLVPLSPKILVSYKSFVDVIGSNVVLPCRFKGHPRPMVVWKDKYGNTIKENERIKVLRSGELVISPLLWSDMGQYTCQASNIFGSTKITTFVYPALPEEIHE